MKCPYCTGGMSPLGLILHGRALYVCETTRSNGISGPVVFSRCGATGTR